MEFQNRNSIINVIDYKQLVKRKEGQYENTHGRLRTRSKERIQRKFREHEWNLQSMSAEWDTILSELEAERIFN
uniref:Transposase n=1 Tax=Heterorhabditis bacteriophora TaxID=37862 RepID=A0A1I7WJI7_HETBA